MAQGVSRADRATATAELAALAAGREALADQRPRLRLGQSLLMAVVLTAAVSASALHNGVLSAIALPFALYAVISLAGVDDWPRMGVIPRRPRGLAAIGLGLYIFIAVPACWTAAYVVDGRGNRWALPVAGVIISFLVVGGRLWTTKIQRAELQG